MSFLTPATGSRRECRRMSLKRLLGGCYRATAQCGRKWCHANQNVTRLGDNFFPLFARGGKPDLMMEANKENAHM